AGRLELQELGIERILEGLHLVRDGLGTDGAVRREAEVPRVLDLAPRAGERLDHLEREIGMLAPRIDGEGDADRAQHRLLPTAHDGGGGKERAGAPRGAL